MNISLVRSLLIGALLLIVSLATSTSTTHADEKKSSTAVLTAKEIFHQTASIPLRYGPVYIIRLKPDLGEIKGRIFRSGQTNYAVGSGTLTLQKIEVGLITITRTNTSGKTVSVVFLDYGLTGSILIGRVEINKKVTEDFNPTSPVFKAMTVDQQTRSLATWQKRYDKALDEIRSLLDSMEPKIRL